MTNTLDRDLHLPINGKTYDIKSPDIPTGRFITKLMSLGMQANDGTLPSDKALESLKLDDDEELDLHARILGPVADQMIADGVSFNDYSLAGQTVMIWVTADAERAMEFWNAGGNPKAAAKTPQDHKKPATKGGAKSARPASTATKSAPKAKTPAKTPVSAESSTTTGT